MVKSFFAVILFTLFHSGVYSQTSISGKVGDTTQAPVPFAVVALLNTSDSAIVKGILTDEKGVYVFNAIHPGNYFLKISAAGFEEKNSPGIIFDSLHNYIVPDIFLHPSKILDAVTISAVTPTIEFKNGNITVNVEDSPLARGNSAYDLLAKLPGVSVENNTITLMGKSGVVLMIDGRVQQISNEQLINVLKAMSAATIRKIEVLKNPPVKYDAAGTSGMINIVTKKSEQRGFNGTVYNETSQGFYNNTSSGIALNYKNEKISIFSGLDGVYDTYLVNTKLYSNFVSDSGNTTLANITSYKAPDAELTYKLGADWYVNELNIIGFKMDGGPGFYNENGNGADHVSGYNNTGFDHLIFSEDGHNKWTTRNYNLNAEHKFDTSGTVLDFSADYTDAVETDHSLYSSYFYDTHDNEVLVPNIYQNTNGSPTKIISSKLDFIHPLDSTASVEAGIKGSMTNMINDYLFERKNNSSGNFYRDSILSNKYFYTEQNLAIYFNYSKTFKSFNLQAGIRGENTSAKSRNTANSLRLSKNYFSLFPDVSFQYSKTDDHVFELNLNRRIDRPTYWDLTPFIVYRDPYSYFSGNPNLQPHFSNKAEFTYSFKGIINTSVSYARINHFMLDYTEQNDSTKILLETSKNINFQNSLAYLLLIKYDFTNWYEILFNGTVTYLEYKGDIREVPFMTKGLNYTMNLTNTFLLPGKTKLEISALYRGPNLFGITKINPVGMISFGIQKSFFKEKLNCSIGMNDIFNNMHFHTHARFDNQDWNFYQSSDTRRISCSISYNFGKIKTDEREINSNEEEKGRLNH